MINYTTTVEVQLQRLMMAPQKCNFIEFTLDKTGKSSSNLDIKLFGTTITECVNPTFLGIRFDKYLSFKNQINYVKMWRIPVLKGWTCKSKKSKLSKIISYFILILECSSTTSIYTPLLKALGYLLFLTNLFYTCLQLSRHYLENVSRRLCNLSFVCLVVSHDVLFILVNSITNNLFRYF